MGWLSRRRRATRKQRSVVVPMIGKSAQLLPMARVRAIFSGVMPCVSWAMTGSRKRRCQNVRVGLAAGAGGAAGEIGSATAANVPATGGHRNDQNGGRVAAAPSGKRLRCHGRAENAFSSRRSERPTP